MDENQIEGTARKYGGRVQEGVGSVTGDYTSAFAMCVVLDLVATAVVLWRPGRRTKLAAS